jgi:hypothetical protein
MDFVVGEVLPRHRWFDYLTYRGEDSSEYNFISIYLFF